MQYKESIFKEERRQWSRELNSVEKIAEETGGLYLDGEKKYEISLKKWEETLLISTISLTRLPRELERQAITK